MDCDVRGARALASAMHSAKRNRQPIFRLLSASRQQCGNTDANCIGCCCRTAVFDVFPLALVSPL
jgi:hypothetical protein